MSLPSDSAARVVFPLLFPLYTRPWEKTDLFTVSANEYEDRRNMFGLNQSAVLIDLHARYRLSDDWFLNAYGGTVEYWFQPTVGRKQG